MILRRPQEPKVEPAPQVIQIPQEPLKTLVEWEVPARAFKARDKKYFTTIFIIIFVLSLILVFVQEFLLIGVILSLTFVYYVLSTVPPENVTHKITTRGVIYAGTNYPWSELVSFFENRKFESHLLNINTKAKLPGRMFLLLPKNAEEKDKILKTVAKYLPEEEKPQMTFAERISEKASQKISLE